MGTNFRRVVSRVLFWNYPRGGWQYDIVSGFILAFIFLTPKAIFDGSIFSPEEEIFVIESEEKVATQSDVEIE